MRYCAYEQESFDEEQFEDDPKHCWIHKRTPRHTVLGERLDRRDLPGELAKEDRGDAE